MSFPVEHSRHVTYRLRGITDDQVSLVLGGDGKDWFIHSELPLKPFGLVFGAFEKPLVDLATGAIVASLDATGDLSIVLRVCTEVHSLRDGELPWTLRLRACRVAASVAFAASQTGAESASFNEASARIKSLSVNRSEVLSVQADVLPSDRLTTHCWCSQL